MNYLGYIKPQLYFAQGCLFARSILWYSYIKPQQLFATSVELPVVSYGIPTSNHNAIRVIISWCTLYLMVFLHQTTTEKTKGEQRRGLYLMVFLHQTTTRPLLHPSKNQLYLMVFLHQTTTCSWDKLTFDGCILWYSYIKPQLWCRQCVSWCCCILWYSYIKPQPNTFIIFAKMLYLMVFLHQTTTFFHSVLV